LRRLLLLILSNSRIAAFSSLLFELIVFDS
jgi:hypothetical protein